MFKEGIATLDGVAGAMALHQAIERPLHSFIHSRFHRVGRGAHRFLNNTSMPYGAPPMQ